MRKHIILFFSALLFLVACKSDKLPAGIIAEDEMIRLLVDVHIVDGALATQPGPDSLYKYGTGRYKQLFKQYHIDTARFRKSVKYYSTKPDQIMVMYDKVATLLKTKSDSLAKIEERKLEKERKQREKIAKEAEKQYRIKEKFRKDSIRRDSIKKAVLAKPSTKKVIPNTIIKKNALPPK